MTGSLENIVSLAKRRGFIFPGSEIYGGLANSWDYGPLGVELKNNIKHYWWQRYVHRRDDIVGLDAAIIMNPKTWEASGHLETFSDPLIECKHCHSRIRADQFSEQSFKLGEDTYVSQYLAVYRSLVQADNQDDESLAKDDYWKSVKLGGSICPVCRQYKGYSQPRSFNLMLKTYLGPAEDSSSVAYLRPETAQAMFINFGQVVQTSRLKLPFGIAQIGKAFRNEITPGNFIFRTREFEQMEIEYFFQAEAEDSWQPHFESWRLEMIDWMKSIGLDVEANIHELEVPADELAHYSKRTIDFEFNFPFGRKELYGLAYRTDFDLRNHGQSYRDQESGQQFFPHVIEPTWGVDRTVLAVLCQAYEEEEDRIVLKLHPRLAPYKAAVFPLLANKPQLVEQARQVYGQLQQDFMVAWDDRGNIGKRYRSQDEIGTPWCITIDFDTLEDGTVTLRNRDNQQQERVAISELTPHISESVK